jgi:hypothetical protein
MAYTRTNYPTKKALLAALAVGPLPIFQPGPFGPNVPDGPCVIEGPHYPRPHRFYLSGYCANNHLIRLAKER